VLFNGLLGLLSFCTTVGLLRLGSCVTDAEPRDESTSEDRRGLPV